MQGEVLGPFRIEQELGSGGMGTVYLATVTGRVRGLAKDDRVALKLVHPHLLEQPGFFKRFLREAEIGIRVDHPNLVRTIDADALVVGGKHHNYLVMEYVEGQTLRQLLEELGRVPEELCRHIAREMGKALGAIHAAGIVHRDIKPDNALITEDENVKIMDLGVARLADEVIRLSQTGAFVGSVLYAAPEQFSGGGGSTDGRADLYALGLTLYELTTGQHPFADEDLRIAMRKQLNEDPRPPSEINPQLSPFFEEVVRTLLAKDRDERFATAEELVAVLEAGENAEWWQSRAQEIRADTHQPLRRIRIARETSLHGRDTELERLRDAYASAKAGEGQVLVIEGEAGIGKTRLVDEFVSQLRQDGEDLNFLFGAYPAGAAATAAGAFSTAYREQFGEIGLQETLGRYLTITPSLIPAFAALLRGEATPKGEEALTKDSLQTVFVHATRALAAERPTIVLIDDLGFAPDDGRALFTALGLAIPDHRVLLVGNVRPGVPDEWTSNVDRSTHAGRITLSRLAPKHFASLLNDAFRSERLAEELGYKVLTKSDGNPFFAFEIIRGLREGKFITQGEDGAWERTQVIQDIQIPSTVMDLIHARIADLTEEERELLDVAACCGYEFDPLLVGEVVGMRRIPLLRALGRIEKTHRLVRSAGVQFVFDHHQVQEVLYEGLSELLRREYHGAIAEALEEREGAATKEPSELPGALAVALAQHYFKGARGEPGRRYLAAALDHLEASYLNDSVIALADRALALSGLLSGQARVDLLVRKANRLGYLGHHGAVRTALDSALETAVAEGLDTAPLHVALGDHLYAISRFGEAEDLLSSVCARAADSGDKVIEARATNCRSGVLRRLGRIVESGEHAERFLAVSRELGDRALEADALVSLAILRAEGGSFGEARQFFEKAHGVATDIGLRVRAATLRANMATLLFAEGDIGPARDGQVAALTVFTEVGFRRWETISTHNLGEAETHLGRLAAGQNALEKALRLSREIEFRNLESATLRLLGTNAWIRGATSDAIATTEEALGLARQFGSYGSEEVKTLIEMGNLLAQTDRKEEARACLSEAMAFSEKTEMYGLGALAAAVLTLLPEGRADEAAHAVVAHGANMNLTARIYAYSLLWKATQDTAHLAEAHRLLEYLRDHAPADCRASMIQNVPLHRDIAAAWAAHKPTAHKPAAE